MCLEKKHVCEVWEFTQTFNLGRPYKETKGATAHDFSPPPLKLCYFRISGVIWSICALLQTRKLKYREENNLLKLILSRGCTPEKAMAPHSSTLVWKIPWMEEPGRLPSMGSRRVRHDWATSLSLFTFMYWRRKWQPTPVLLPGESQGRGSLVGCRLWGCTELDKTEVT